MRTIIFGFATAVIIAANPAFGQSELTPPQRKWVEDMQQCILEKDIPYNNSGCAVHDNLKLWCADKHKAAGIECLREVSSQASKKIIPLLKPKSKDKDD